MTVFNPARLADSERFIVESMILQAVFALSEVHHTPDAPGYLQMCVHSPRAKSDVHVVVTQERLEPLVELQDPDSGIHRRTCCNMFVCFNPLDRQWHHRSG